MTTKTTNNNKGGSHVTIRGAGDGFPGALEARDALLALLQTNPRQHSLRLVLKRQLLLHSVLRDLSNIKSS